jgi:DNA end-binding protein Ku
MAASMWKGHISFGLVNIPVSLHSAETRDELKFRMLDRRNNAKVRYKRVNDATGEDVPWGEIVKAYPLDKNSFVILEIEDFRQAALEATQSVEIEAFVDEDSIDTVYFEKPYYVVPQKKAEKGYVLLRDVLKKTGKIGIARVVMGARQYIAALIPAGNALVLDILRYQHELKDPSEFSFPGEAPEAYKITPKEVSLAELLVDNLSGEWEPQAFKDEYRSALLRYIEEKAKGGISAPAEPEGERRESGKVIDMMELLKRSVEQVSKRGGKRKRREPAASSGGRKKAVGDEA